MTDMPSPEGSETDPARVVEVAHADSATAGSETATEAFSLGTDKATQALSFDAATAAARDERRVAGEQPGHLRSVNLRGGLRAGLRAAFRVGDDARVATGSHKSGRWQ